MGPVRAAGVVVFSLVLLGVSAPDDPLPRVRAKADVPPENTNVPQISSTVTYEMPVIALAVEPLWDIAAATVDVRDSASAVAAMHDALASNDAARFTAAYAKAKELGAKLGVYEDIATVWSFANSNPTGAFYDAESMPGLHDRLAAKYPGYASYIEKYRLTDANGRVFYPTSETRAFLARQVGAAPAAAAPRRAEKLSPPAIESAAPPTPAAPAAPKTRRHRTVKKAETETATPAKTKPAATAAPKQPPAPAVAAAATPTAPKESTAPPKLAEPTTAPAPQPQQSAAPTTATTTAEQTSNGRGESWILFGILAILAIGAIALFVRRAQSTSEEPPTLIAAAPPADAPKTPTAVPDKIAPVPQPAPPAQPQGAKAPAPQQQPAQPEKPRVTKAS